MKTLLLVCASLAIVALTFAAEKVQKPAVLEKTFFRDVPRPPRSDDHSSLKIWNGQIAKRGQFPFYVGVYIDVSAFCGGSLIHPKWVVTAAHCVDGGSYWVLFMGVTKMSLAKEDGREVHVSRGGFKHPEYNSQRIVNDIGLIQLLEDVSTSADIAIIPLTPPGKSYVGTNPTVAGFGVTGDSASTISDALRYTSMPVVDPDVCYNVYGDKDASQLCLETDKVMTSSCSGDSGGPLILNDAQNKPFLIGATSFGARAGCAKGYPVGFTNLAIFIEWISKSTGINFDTTK